MRFALLVEVVMENYPPYQVECGGEAVDLVFGPRNSCLVILPITRSENIHVNARNDALRPWVITDNFSRAQIYGYGFWRPENELGSMESLPFYPVALVYEQSTSNTLSGSLHVVDIRIGERNLDAPYVMALGADIIQMLKFGRIKKGEKLLHPQTSGERIFIWR